MLRTGQSPNGSLLNGAQAAARLPHPALAIALAILFEAAPLVVFVFLASSDSFPETLLPSSFALLGILVAVYGLYIVQVGIWVGFWERRTLSSAGFDRAGALGKLLRGGVVGAGIYLALLFVLVAFGWVTLRSEMDARDSGLVAAAAAIVFVGWAVQGTAEELLYRGWLLPVVAVRTRLRWGILASTLVFAVTHLLGNPFDPLLMVNLVCFGVFFALWALREGALWGVIGWHVAVNWLSENLVVIGEGFGVGPLEDGVLLGFDESGPDLITGGSVGLEASLLTTAMLCASILILLFASGRRLPDVMNIR